MRKKLAALLAGAMLLVATSAMALPMITGTVDFAGSFKTDTNNLSTATQIIFQSMALNPFVTPTGSYAALAAAPFPTSVLFNPLTFNPSTAVSPLWLLSINLPSAGTIYDFNLSSVSIIDQQSNFLSLSGVGTLEITGYDPTPGTWTFASTGGLNGTYTAGFVSESAAVPEPGTMVLLGAGLLSLAVYGKRRMNKEA